MNQFAEPLIFALARVTVFLAAAALMVGVALRATS
jgi:hypothetical protein